MGAEKEDPWYDLFVLWSSSVSDSPHLYSILVRYHFIRPYFGAYV